MCKRRLLQLFVLMAVVVSVFFASSVPVLAADEDMSLDLLSNLDVSFSSSPISCVMSCIGSSYYDITNKYDKITKTAFEGAAGLNAKITNNNSSGVYINGTFSVYVNAYRYDNSSTSAFLNEGCVIDSVVSCSGSGWSMSFVPSVTQIGTSSSKIGTLVLSFSDFYLAPGTSFEFGTCDVYFAAYLVTNSTSSTWLSDYLVFTSFSGDFLTDATVALSPSGEAAYIVDSITGAINSIDSGTGNIVTSQQQIAAADAARQESIAAAQSSQSAQQHEDLKSGFEDNSYNNQVSSASDAVDDYLVSESDLLDSQKSQINDYVDSSFNVNSLSPFLPSIVAVSTWFSQIWVSFGNLNTAFVVILSLGFASFLIGLTRRR